MRSSPLASKELAGGCVLVALGLLGLYAGRGLKIGSLAAMGPGFFPLLLSALVLVVGLGLVAAGLLREGETVEKMMPGRVAMIALAVILFGMLVRGASVGPLTIPACGVVIAAPVCMIVSGFSTGWPRMAPLLANALIMPALAILLFADLLNLPMPVFPDALRGNLPPGWTEKAALRAISGGMIVAGAALVMLGRARASRMQAQG